MPCNIKKRKKERKKEIRTESLKYALKVRQMCIRTDVNVWAINSQWQFH